MHVDAFRADEPLPAGACYRVAWNGLTGRGDEAAPAPVRSAISAALLERGLLEAARPDLADVVIEVDCSVEPGQVDAMPKRDGGAAPSADDRHSRAVWMPDGSVSYQSPLRAAAPGFEQPTEVVLRRAYEKRVTIVARSVGRPGAMKRDRGIEFWRVQASLEDERDGIETCLPMLITEALARLGRPEAEPANRNGPTSVASNAR